jgi:hypothetical protein
MPSDRPPLQPILLLFAARSGSTLLMQLLGSSPQVVFERSYPFETRYLAFYLRWAWQLADAGLRRDEWTTERLVAERPSPGNRIEPPPFAMPAGFAVDGPSPLWHAAFHTAWQEFSRRARQCESCAPGRDPTAIYYAEKSRTPYRGSLQELGVPHQVIYLLRDPRDILQSIWAFNRKRGTTSFSVQPDESERDFALRFLDERRRRLRVLLELAPDDPAATIVRYEDMILDLPGVAARLSSRLGVRLDAPAVLAQQKDFADHMSSRGPRASIGRWRREMAPEIQLLFATEIGRELQALGYEL